MAENHSIVHIDFIPTNDKSENYSIEFDSVEYLYVIEDIYSFNITAKIGFYDRMGLVEFAPMNGFEKFQISFGNAEGSLKYKTLVFDIFKIEKIEQVRQGKMHDGTYIELLLVDEYYHKFNSNGWNKSWVNKKGSDIIRDIAKNHLGFDTFNKFEISRENIEQFDTHLKTPTECISWLMDRSSSSVSGQPGYMFYRSGADKDFSYNLVSLETLLSEKKYLKPKGENHVYGFEQGNQYYINSIRRFDVRHVDLNALKSLVGGSLMGFDIKRKKLIRRDFSFKDAVKRFTVLGSKTLFIEDMPVDRPTKMIETLDSEDMLDNIWYGNWIREYCNQQLVEITVDGHQDRYAGGMIRILWPSKDELGDVLNRQMDGKYLVKSITHYFSPKDSVGWRQKLVCIKNGYKDSINTKLIKAEKVNIQ